NAVRLPLSVASWQAGGQAYLDRAASLVSAANAEGLIVILGAHENGVALPDAAAADFWKSAATFFKSTPGVVFSLFDEPSPRGIAGDRTAAWRAWAAAMQPLADAIRAAGASQPLAATAFQDGLDFQGFGRDFFLRDPNVMYEVHTSAATDDARDRNFGFLTNDVVIYAGEWAAVGGACPVTSDDTLAALSYFDRRGVSWTASDFAPGSLIADYDDFTPSKTCAAGPAILLWMTGDPLGFGSIDATQIANAAGGYPGPVAPGEILSIYGQVIGPQAALGPHLTAGLVDTSVGDVQAFFDGIPAPILLAGYFQVNVQVPYELAGRTRTALQLVYRGVPSNIAELDVADTAPGIFTTFTGGSDALVVNQDGTLNTAENAAPRGSIVSIYATGAGQTSPPSLTGIPAGPPVATPGARVSVTVAERSADILYAGPAPTFVGLTQVNARVPADVPTGRAPVIVTCGSASSRTGVVFWVK
ncbi:MAG TPA: cellulase family glycosylhydrolase, partial [Bryobacteraceae bacterium]